MARRALVLAVAASLAVSCGPRSRDEARFGEISQAVMVCPSNVVEGVDVYDGQGSIDWTQVYGAGRRFAFIKATQGDYDTQTTFAADWAGALDAGVIRSPYHFFDPTIDGIAQANHFIAVWMDGGSLPGDLPPLLDLECPTSSTQSAADMNCEYTGNSGWVDTATLKQRTYDWLNTVQAAAGRPPIIYSYPSWFGDVGFTDAQLTQYPLFIATLSNCADVPAPWTTAVFWQYSFTGTVAGISGQVDLDRFIGTEAELTGFANGTVDGGASDAGTTTDAGAATDAGTTRPDAGSGADAGEAGPDAGSGLGMDSGSPRSDGGPGGGTSTGGCNCAASTPELLWALGFAGVLVARRRRR